MRGREVIDHDTTNPAAAEFVFTHGIHEVELVENGFTLSWRRSNGPRGQVNRAVHM